MTLNPSYRNAWRIAEQFPGMKGLIIFGILLEEGKEILGINPLTPMSDQDRIAPYQYINQACDENEEKYQFKDYNLDPIPNSLK